VFAADESKTQQVVAAGVPDPPARPISPGGCGPETPQRRDDFLPRAFGKAKSSLGKIVTNAPFWELKNHEIMA